MYDPPKTVARGWCGELSGPVEPRESPRSEAERGRYAWRKGFEFPMLLCDDDVYAIIADVSVG
jgi:hypothetical protein